VSATVFRPEGAPTNQPGAERHTGALTQVSERPRVLARKGRNRACFALCRPFRACPTRGTRFPGRCPGLDCGCPFGADEKRLQSASRTPHFQFCLINLDKSLPRRQPAVMFDRTSVVESLFGRTGGRHGSIARHQNDRLVGGGRPASARVRDLPPMRPRFIATSSWRASKASRPS
jgi:hypothetical protein